MKSAARAAALWAGTCAVAVSGILPAAAVERGTGAPPAGLVAALERTVADGFPGAVAYARRGERESRTAAGLADTATGERARPDHRFRIASNTKSFVSTVLLQLEGEGRLSLDDSVGTWLPGMVRGHGNDGRTVTVRQLLNHTSGIYDPTDEVEFSAPYLERGDRAHVYTPREVIARAVRHEPPFKPGRGWAYSNTNYLLAGLVIEAVTHRSAPSEIRRRILIPLGLKDTSFPVTDPDIHRPHLHGYDLDGRDVTRFSPSYGPGAERISARATDGGGPGFTSVSLTTADGERQLVLAFNVFDLGANPRRPRPVPYTEALDRAQTAVLCD
ncbi:serine hydrolase domain-containing protein [Streptomyces erythrochromogenes]|uniref:serine hydrolase domain-containing protein n=1 Tax=Streptomyces erythrochromogenes TaxID=285574 RepID=UPI0036FC97D1